MSLIVGVACPEGVVLAADSGMATRGAYEWSTHIPYPDKIRPLAGAPLVYGTVGSVSAGQHVDVALGGGGVPLPLQLSALRRDLADRLARHVPATAQKDGLGLLVGGLFDGLPGLLEFTAHGDVAHRRGDAAALGSAQQIAEVVLEPYRGHMDTLDRATLLAYRTVRAAINLATILLKPPIVVWTVNADGVVRPIVGAELNGYEHRASRWRAADVATFLKA